MPEPLVMICSYGTEDEAHTDLALLHSAGLTAYVATHGRGHGGHSVLLHVVESDVDAAVGLLGKPPGVSAEADASTDYACPRCGSDRSTALPPWFGIALVASFAAGSVPVLLNSWKTAVAVAVVGGFAIHRAEAAPDWRCLNCQFRWKSKTDAVRRAEARRAAPE